MLSRLLAFAFCLAAPHLLAQDRPYVLKTEWQCSDGSKREPTIEYFATEAERTLEMEAMNKKWGPGGLMQYDACKPSRFLTWYDGGSQPKSAKDNLDPAESALKSPALPGYSKIPESIRSERKSSGSSPGDEVASLAGSKGSGTIGTRKVQCEFSDSGELLVTGDLNGKGKWKQLGKFVQIETNNATLEGRCDGVNLGGKLTIKSNGTKMDWQLKMSARESAIKGDEEIDKQSIVVGRWTHQYIGNESIGGYGYFETLDVRPNGQMFLEWGDTGPTSRPTGPQIGAKGTYTWRLEAPNIIFEQVSMEKGSYTKKITIKVVDLGAKYKK